ncbi:MAG TPA: MFS transporter [Blastocatellia bacterium]|nr:MFS transporter [Blastocatellia bacterium]
MSQSRAFGAIYLSIAISYLGVGLVAPIIASVLTKHGENSFVVGLIGTTMFTTFTLASFPVGNLIDRIGPKPVLVGGLIIYGASIALFALNLTTGLFFMARAIEGVGAAAISVATETMISKLSEPNERARRMSYYALSVGLGWAAGPLAGALLFKIGPGFPFIACFVLSLLAALSAQALIPETASTSHHVEGITTRLTKKIIVPMSAGGLYGYLMSSLVTLIPIYLEKVLSIQETEVGIIITAVIIGTLASQVPIGRAADRFGKRRTLLVCSIVMSVVFALMAFHHDWRLFIATGAVLGAVAGSLYPIGLAIIGGIVGRERLGAATSMFSLAFGFGSLVGPSASGFAMIHLGDRWLFYIPCILTALFALELIVLYKRIASRKKMDIQQA